MRFFHFLAYGAIFSVGLAVPASESRKVSSVCVFGDPEPCTGEEVDVRSMPTGRVTARVENPPNMYSGKEYNFWGWKFRIANMLVQQLGDTTWVLPEDESGKNWLSNVVANSISRTLGDGSKRQIIGGGWTWYGEVGNGFKFNDLGHDIMILLFKEAINAATDWITEENYVTFAMVDSVGVQIAKFALFPTNGNFHNVKNYHQQ